uniref:Uncharacterized protein n=1 Tax=Octopus bimaculoides TaxID=37653 RepID=A0A0L8FM68_OCTBM
MCQNEFTSLLKICQCTVKAKILHIKTLLTQKCNLVIQTISEQNPRPKMIKV